MNEHETLKHCTATPPEELAELNSAAITVHNGEVLVWFVDEIDGRTVKQHFHLDAGNAFAMGCEIAGAAVGLMKQHLIQLQADAAVTVALAHAEHEQRGE